eukprot:gb/GECG01014426.1/.p1 GENE.gb/GECG01014426.1/~~gb/GECG01014426.1/.p1  ORF type:complete len:599 (+),score=71.31 gb/GECG01014426.1/:1-1797(+)
MSERGFDGTHATVKSDSCFKQPTLREAVPLRHCDKEVRPTNGHHRISALDQGRLSGYCDLVNCPQPCLADVRQSVDVGVGVGVYLPSDSVGDATPASPAGAVNRVVAGNRIWFGSSNYGSQPTSNVGTGLGMGIGTDYAYAFGGPAFDVSSSSSAHAELSNIENHEGNTLEPYREVPRRSRLWQRSQVVEPPPVDQVWMAAALAGNASRSSNAASGPNGRPRSSNSHESGISAAGQPESEGGASAPPEAHTRPTTSDSYISSLSNASGHVSWNQHNEGGRNVRIPQHHQVFDHYSTHPREEGPSAEERQVDMSNSDTEFVPSIGADTASAIREPECTQGSETLYDRPSTTVLLGRRNHREDSGNSAVRPQTTGGERTGEDLWRLQEELQRLRTLREQQQRRYEELREERDSQLQRQRELQDRRQRAEELAGSLESERSAMLDRYESLQARVHTLSTTLESIQTQAQDIQDGVASDTYSEPSQFRRDTTVDALTHRSTASTGTNPHSTSPLRATGSSSMRTTWSTARPSTPPRESEQSANNNVRGSPRWGYTPSRSNARDRQLRDMRSDALEDSLQSLESQLSQSPGGSPRRDNHPPNN